MTRDFGSGYERDLVMGAQRDAIDEGDEVLVVDDVSVAGWSAVGAVRLVGKMGVACTGIAIAIELAHLAGRRNLSAWTTVPVFAAATTIAR